jgi:xanthine dehydrogenase accessory factor
VKSLPESPPGAQKRDSDSDPARSAVPLRVLVLGGGDVGSAVAHDLFQLSHWVVIAEKPGSCHARRGMAFIDAIFDGIARLDGIAAQLEPDLAGVRRCWRGGEVIPIVVFSEQALLDALHFDVLVDATMRRTDLATDLRGLARLTIGIGPGYTPGRNCHVAIETQWGPAMGQVLHDVPAALRSGGPPPLGGVSRERFSIAPDSGLWSTQCAVGQRVLAGDVVGYVAGLPVHAQVDGVLRGIAHDGAQVGAGQRVVEVDPRDATTVHGRGERPLAVAAGVTSAVERFGRPR